MLSKYMEINIDVFVLLSYKSVFLFQKIITFLFYNIFFII